MKDKLIIIFIIIFSLALYALTLRGSIGNGTATEVKGNLDQTTGALELSPERGRFAHVVNLAERGHYDLNKTWANIVYPDVGFAGDKFYSFFAPGVSYMATPLYMAGAKYNLGQIGAFSTETIIAILALVFLYKNARYIFGVSRSAAIFAVIVFAFGSTFWSYAVTLYQHAFTAFFMMSGIYAVWSFRTYRGGKWNWLFGAYVWLAYALAITVDYPNAIMYLPIMVYFLFSTISFERVKEGYKVSVRWAGIITAIVFVAITSLHFWHNQYYYGSWKQTAGGLPTYIKTVATTTPVVPRFVATLGGANATTTPAYGASSTLSVASTTAAAVSTSTPKDIVGFFSEKYLPNSLYILLLSPDRGLLLFCPIFIMAFLGMYYALKKPLPEHALLIGLISVNLFLYGSWGDPWGGWAYGPRYAIPSMACLSLFVAIGLSSRLGEFWRQLFARIFAYILFLYSSAIAILGAVTTNAIPPKSEAILLPVKKYNFLLNVDFMKTDHSGSFIYNTFAGNTLTLFGYAAFIYMFVISVAAIVLFAPMVKRLITRHE